MSKRQHTSSTVGTTREWPHACFAARACATDDDGEAHLLHHLERLEQAYRSRLPSALADDALLGFNLANGRAGAQERIAQLFDAKWRSANLRPDVAKAVFKALAGPNPQGQCWKGWRQSGFGETQVSGPRAAIVHADAIARTYAEIWGCPAVCEGVPTTILRPPKSGALAAHIDSGSLLEMYVATRGMVTSGRGGARDWAARHGCQALVHWLGPDPARARAAGASRSPPSSAVQSIVAVL